jgi:glycosyltransferase involved in cell wall biosynthesis
MARLSISILIPTLEERGRIEQAVVAASLIGDEVVVADALSRDGTAAAAARAGARVVLAGGGRGPQIDAAARVAQGDVLVVLHADCRLPPAARGALESALGDPAVVGGNFRLRFEPPTLAAQLFSAASDLRRRLFAIYYGDSAMFLRRSVYRALGGMRALPILEDYELARRLERFGRTVYIRHVEVSASARRFARAPARTLATWTVVQGLYSLGVPPRRLRALYPPRPDRPSDSLAAAALAARVDYRA